MTTHSWKLVTIPKATNDITLHRDRLDVPLRWRKPREVWVRDDLFHASVPDGFIAWAWMTMARTPFNTYHIRTEHPERMRDFMYRWDDLTGETGDFKGVRGPDATRAAHPSGRGQLFAAYLDEIGKEFGGVPPPGAAWPTFDWMEGPRWWWPVLNIVCDAGTDEAA